MNPHRDASGRFAPVVPRDMVALRAAYEGNEILLEEICLEHGIGVRTLQRLVNTGNWRQRQPRRIDRNDLIMRMFRLLNVHLLAMEKTMTKPGPEEVAVLGRMISSLDKLIALKDAEAKKHSPPRSQSDAIVTLRLKVADRIAELNQS